MYSTMRSSLQLANTRRTGLRAAAMSEGMMWCLTILTTSLGIWTVTLSSHSVTHQTRRRMPDSNEQRIAVQKGLDADIERVFDKLRNIKQSKGANFNKKSWSTKKGLEHIDRKHIFEIADDIIDISKKHTLTQLKESNFKELKYTWELFTSLYYLRITLHDPERRDLKMHTYFQNCDNIGAFCKAIKSFETTYWKLERDDLGKLCCVEGLVSVKTLMQNIYRNRCGNNDKQALLDMLDYILKNKLRKHVKKLNPEFQYEKRKFITSWLLYECPIDDLSDKYVEETFGIQPKVRTILEDTAMKLAHKVKENPDNIYLLMEFLENNEICRKIKMIKDIVEEFFPTED